MENQANLHQLEENLIKKLNEVKDIMDGQRRELEFSIRRDLVAVQLKDLLESHTSFHSLKAALEDYIQDLYKVVEIKKEDKEDDENNKQE